MKLLVHDFDAVTGPVQKRIRRNPGRLTRYTHELAAEICGRICEGESVREICNDPSMPSRSTVTGWLADPDKRRFRLICEIAKDEDRFASAEEIIAIADDRKFSAKTRRKMIEPMMRAVSRRAVKSIFRLPTLSESKNSELIIPIGIR